MRVRIKPSSNAPAGLLNDVRFWWCLLAFAIFCLSGCGDFFAEKPTELQAKSILSDLSRIKTVSGPNIPVPYIYRQPSGILETKDGVKLFYFAQYHTVDKLSGLIREQLDYKVSQSPPVNQLIIRCPTREEAEITLEFLKQVDVPPIQVRIDCLVSELYADVTMDWETTIKIENLLGERIALGGKEIREVVGGVVTDVLLPAFPGASLRDEARELLGLKVGYSRKLGILGHEFRALVDLLVSRGYLKILMNPTLEVVNGKTARIEAKDFVPLPKEVIQPGDVLPYMTTEYKWVVDSLEITPYVFADGYIGLETKALIGSKATPEGVKQIPIITERTIQNKENRIRQGESLIIGGIRKSEKRSVVRGVPFLKDIPLIGILFSSKDFEERAKEVIFIITPTISTGGIPNEKMMAEIKRKHANVKYKRGSMRGSNDSLRRDEYTERIARQAARAEFEQLKTDLEKAKALEEVDQMKERPLKTTKAEKVEVDTQKATIKDGLKQLLESLNPKR